MATEIEKVLRAQVKAQAVTIASQQRQIEMLTQSVDRVIAAKFDRPLVMTEPIEPGSDASRIPMAQFQDVMSYDDDEDFIAAVEGHAGVTQ